MLPHMGHRHPSRCHCNVAFLHTLFAYSKKEKETCTFLQPVKMKVTVLLALATAAVADIINNEVSRANYNMRMSSIAY